jgi:hypothetical protein
MTRLISYSPFYRETEPEFKIGDVPPAIFTRLGTQGFSPLLAAERRPMWTSLQIRREVKEVVHDRLA